MLDCVANQLIHDAIKHPKVNAQLITENFKLDIVQYLLRILKATLNFYPSLLKSNLKWDQEELQVSGKSLVL